MAAYHRWCAQAHTDAWDSVEEQTKELTFSKDSTAKIFRNESAFMLSLSTQIEENPSVVIAAFEELRRCRCVVKYVTFT